MKSSEVATLRRWIDALPADIVLRTRPLLNVYHGGALLLLGEPLADAEACRAAFAHPGGAGGGAVTFRPCWPPSRGQSQASDRLPSARRSCRNRVPFRSCVSLVTA